MSKIEGPLSDKTIAQIRERAVTNAVGYIDETCANSSGDTPIERALFAAVKCEIEFGHHEIYEFENLFSWEVVAERCDGTTGRLVCQRQAYLLDWPVDFVFSVRNRHDRVVSLAVECDGHDFHERSREQAKRDRSRDRMLQEAGYTVYRFTGSEINNDPCGCADSIINWAINESCFGHQRYGRVY